MTDVTSTQSLAYEESARAFQAIAAEVSDYSRRLLQDGTVTMGQIVRAKSPPEAINVWVAFGKRTVEEYLQQAAKITSMYSNVATQQSVALQTLLVPHRK
jgi:hypothetical protein